MIHVDAESFFAIVLVAALAATAVALLPRRFAPPVVVVELVLGATRSTSSASAVARSTVHLGYSAGSQDLLFHVITVNN